MTCENLDSAVQVFERAWLSIPATPWPTRARALIEEIRSNKEAHGLKKPPSLPTGQSSGQQCLPPSVLGTLSAEPETIRGSARIRRAVETEPYNDDAFRGLPEPTSVRQPEEAENTYRRAIELRPHYWAGYNWLGHLTSACTHPEAAEMFNQVVALAPDSFLGYSNLVLLTLSRPTMQTQ